MSSSDAAKKLEEVLGVKLDENEAEALSFLYSHAEYGFKPTEVCEHTSIPKGDTVEVLARLLNKDGIGKTHDGYFHALDDPIVANLAVDLGDGSFDLGQ